MLSIVRVEIYHIVLSFLVVGRACGHSLVDLVCIAESVLFILSVKVVSSLTLLQASIVAITERYTYPNP